MNIIKPFLASFLLVASRIRRFGSHCVTPRLKATQSAATVKSSLYRLQPRPSRFPTRWHAALLRTWDTTDDVLLCSKVHEIEADLTDACIANALRFALPRGSLSQVLGCSENPNYTLAQMKGGTLVLMEYQLVMNPSMRLAIDRFTFTGAEGVTVHGDPVPVMDDPKLRECFWCRIALVRPARSSVPELREAACRGLRYGSDLNWDDFIIPTAQQAKLDAIPGWVRPQHQQPSAIRTPAQLAKGRDAAVQCQRQAPPRKAQEQGQTQASPAGAVPVVPRASPAGAVPVVPRQRRAAQTAAVAVPVPIVPPQEPRAQQEAAPVVTRQRRTAQATPAEPVPVASQRPPVSKVVAAVVSHTLSSVSNRATTTQSQERPTTVQQSEDHTQPRRSHTRSCDGIPTPKPDKDQPPTKSPATSSMSGKRSADSALGFNSAQLRVLKKLALNLCPASTKPTTPGDMLDDPITQHKASSAQDGGLHPSATDICKAAAERQLRKAGKPLQKIRDVRKASEKSKSNTQRKQRVRWTLEEVTQLEEGVERFGIGRWTDILGTGKFDSVRSTTDLKDKWRNIRLAKNVTKLP